MARGLWILGRPPVFGDGRCGAKQLHSASERSVEYMVMQPSVRCRRLARATFQTVSPRTWVNKGKKQGRSAWPRPSLVRFATPSFARFLRNLLALPLHLVEFDGHLAFGVHAVAHQNMHSSLRAVRPPARGVLDAGVGTNEPVEAPGVERLKLYKAPGVGRACPVCGDGDELPFKQAVHMEWREEVALCVSAGGGDVERGTRRDGGDGRLVGVAGQRAGEGLRFLVVCGDRDRLGPSGPGNGQHQAS